ncbi:hypothetical protein ABW19_dt0209753 [Dactylella cylindrospora]|nr:hypothetical protein ABW19_dt0209753 [Dactylella cylindrospora]
MFRIDYMIDLFIFPHLESGCLKRLEVIERETKDDTISVAAPYLHHAFRAPKNDLDLTALIKPPTDPSQTVYKRFRSLEVFRYHSELKIFGVKDISVEHVFLSFPNLKALDLSTRDDRFDFTNFHLPEEMTNLTTLALMSPHQDLVPDYDSLHENLTQRLILNGFPNLKDMTWYVRKLSPVSDSGPSAPVDVQWWGIRYRVEHTDGAGPAKVIKIGSMPPPELWWGQETCEYNVAYAHA